MLLVVLLDIDVAGRSFSFAGEAKTSALFLDKHWGPAHNLATSTSQYFVMLRFKEEQNRIPIKTKPVSGLTSAVRLSETVTDKESLTFFYTQNFC